jgi:4-diphosphocytidyl-2-C-methyl-D-erythritol kinase
MSTLAVRCPAKVNLHLEVLGRRPDGYHELRTLFVAVGVWDELRLAPAPEGVLELAVEPDSAVSAGPDNLVLRAARAAAGAWGPRAGARITLVKRIPIGGGMGGGSADAAAALVGLAALWGQPPDATALLPLAAALGSDVPYFLVGGAAWGVGRGTELRPLADLPEWWIVLLPGEAPVSTAEVYRLLNVGPVGGAAASRVYDWSMAGGALPLEACRNDLEAPVVARFPSVGRRVEAMRATSPLLAMVSGSGGTVYGLFPTEAAAVAASRRVASFGPSLAPVLTREQSLLRPVRLEGR